MTRITIAAFGTRGDVAPLVALGSAIRDRLGVEVAIAAQQPYATMIADAWAWAQAHPDGYTS